jgi:hypothetical protein
MHARQTKYLRSSRQCGLAGRLAGHMNRKTLYSKVLYVKQLHHQISNALPINALEKTLRIPDLLIRYDGRVCPIRAYLNG